MTRTEMERAQRQAGTLDEAGTPRLGVVLVALLGPAVAWSLHFLLSYVLLAYACSAGMPGTRLALVAVSLVALVVSAWCGLMALRHWRVARAVDRPTDDAWDARMGERTARISFLMVTGLLLAGIFITGILYEAVTIFLSPLCQPGVSS